MPDEAKRKPSGHDHKFPPALALDCLRAFIAITRSGKLVEKRWEAIQHLAWFVGSAAALFEKGPVIATDGGGEPIQRIAGTRDKNKHSAIESLEHLGEVFAERIEALEADDAAKSDVCKLTVVDAIHGIELARVL